MNILYLTYFDIDDENMLGVKTKIMSQIKALEFLDNKVTLAYRKDSTIIFTENGIEVNRISISKGFTRYKKSVSESISKYFNDNNYDFLYLRFPKTLDPTILRMLKTIGRDKIIFEIPTYPLKGEYILELKKLLRNGEFLETIIKIAVFTQHYFCSLRMKNYLNHIVTFMDFDLIWKVPVISIDNGVDTSKFMTAKRDSNNGVFTIVGVANVSKWHGYDRVIEGIKDYSGEILFKIVGNGDEIEHLKKLVELYNLSSKVEFCGPVYGKNLMKIYNEVDMAVSSLALHRVGLTSGSTIKTKEYCSLGIPFIYAYDEKELNIEFPYAMKLDSTDTPVSISDIKRFHNNLKDKDYPNEMHMYAKENYDWNVQMSKLLEEVLK